MRASLIALIALVASPLMVFAAPSSQVGSLAERDAVPPSGGPSDNLDALTPREILNRIQNVAPGTGKDLLDKLSDSQIEEILKTMAPEELPGFFEKVRGNNKVLGIARKLGLSF